MLKSFCLILASILLTVAVYNVMSANYANRVVARYVHIVPEKSTDTCSVFRMGEHIVVTINESEIKVKK